MGLFSKKKNLPLTSITPDVLSYWRMKYPDGIFDISINGKVGYFRNLSAPEIERELMFFTKKPTSNAGKEQDATDLSFRLIEMAMLGGDMELLTNENLKAAVLQQVGERVLKNIKDTFNI